MVQKAHSTRPSPFQQSKGPQFLFRPNRDFKALAKIKQINHYVN